MTQAIRSMLEGFAAEVPEAEIARLCHERGVPLVVDLGSGALIDLKRSGLPHEATPAESIVSGADLGTFGDKLLGGPEAAIIAGRADLVKTIRCNPLKRALRTDKMTVAAVAAVLRLYSHPERLRNRLPTLRLLPRPPEDIRGMADRIGDLVAPMLAGIASVESPFCESPPGASIAIRSAAQRRNSGSALERIARAFRELPLQAVGRIQNGALILDPGCLEDETAFVDHLPALKIRLVSTK